MAKKENYAETLSDFRKQMQQCEGMTFDQGPEFEEWLDNFETEIQKVSYKMLKKLPKSFRKEGFAEAYFIGLARFTCRILNKMERQGMFSDGKDGFGFYTKVLLPVCNDMVVDEMDEDERAEKVTAKIVADIKNFDISIDDILQKHFSGREDEWSEIRKSLEECRKIAKKHKEESKCIPAGLGPIRYIMTGNVISEKVGNDYIDRITMIFPDDSNEEEVKVIRSIVFAQADDILDNTSEEETRITEKKLCKEWMAVFGSVYRDFNNKVVIERNVSGMVTVTFKVKFMY